MKLYDNMGNEIEDGNFTYHAIIVKADGGSCSSSAWYTDRRRAEKAGERLMRAYIKKGAEVTVRLTAIENCIENETASRI